MTKAFVMSKDIAIIARSFEVIQLKRLSKTLMQSSSILVLFSMLKEFTPRFGTFFRIVTSWASVPIGYPSSMPICSSRYEPFIFSRSIKNVFSNQYEQALLICLSLVFASNYISFRKKNKFHDPF